VPTIKKRESYRWSVRHEVAQRAGKPEYLEFDVEFKALPLAKVNELIARSAIGELGNQAFVEETMVGWHDMQRDGDAAPWAFSVAAVLELCEQYPGMPRSIVVAWTDSVSGGAARKN